MIKLKKEFCMFELKIRLLPSKYKLSGDEDQYHWCRRFLINVFCTISIFEKN